MPKQMELDLKAEARKKGLTGKHADAYVYGTMRKTGWTPGQGTEGNSPTSNFHSQVQGALKQGKK
jgi:hypothetical protein